ncbi:MAG: hypothetical protein ACRCZ9_02005 [Fusobacteriaceae bacterium]
MKKLTMVLALLGAFSFTALAAQDDSTSSSDSMGMMAAFMGVEEVAGGEVSGGAVTPTAAATATVAATITVSNVTTSTPYSYK